MRELNGRDPVSDGSQGAGPESVKPAPALTHITRAVADDWSVEVSIGPDAGGSYADLDQRKVVLAEGQVKDNGEFVAAHEGAHLRFTPTFHKLGADPAKLVAQIGLLPLKNVLEDSAINDLIARLYPDLEPHVRLAYPRDHKELGFISHPEVLEQARRIGFVPRYARALAALLSDWSESRHRLGFGKQSNTYQSDAYEGPTVNDPAIDEFLRATLGHYRAAVTFIGAEKPDPQAIFELGRKRHLWAEQVIYPHLQKLLEEDLKQIEKDIKGAQQSQRANSGQGKSENRADGSSDGPANQTQGERDTKNGKSKPAADQSCAGDAENRRKAREMIASFDDAIRKALRSACDKQGEAPSTQAIVERENDATRAQEVAAAFSADCSSGGKALREAVLRVLSPYEKYYHDVASRIDEVEGQLRDVFIPNSHFRWQGGQPSGTRITMNAAMRFQATGEGANELFERRIDPTRPDIGVIVLVDRSGSMEGEKIIAAIKAAVFTKEVFQRIGVKCAVVGFSDTQDVLAGFDDDSRDQDVQKRLMSGLSVSGGTCDAAAIKRCIELIQASHHRRSAVVMLSDGQSGEGDDLRHTVKNLAESGVPVVHFGLGAGTSDTNSYYTPGRTFGDLEVQGVGDKDFFTVFAREMEVLGRELYV
jgi:hypothetical protein